MSTAHGPLEPQMSIICRWLESGTASWDTLATALKDELVGHGATANDIAKKYPKGIYYSIILIDRYAQCKLFVFVFEHFPSNLLMYI